MLEISHLTVRGTPWRENMDFKAAMMLFADFAREYDFSHITSSPQSNGQAERSVQTVKKLLRESGDRHYSTTEQLLSHGVT